MSIFRSSTNKDQKQLSVSFEYGRPDAHIEVSVRANVDMYSVNFLEVMSAETKQEAVTALGLAVRDAVAEALGKYSSGHRVYAEVICQGITEEIRRI